MEGDEAVFGESTAGDKMKEAFAECYLSVLACEEEGGRKRCELFRELPDKQEYPDYYELIAQPIASSIALSDIRTRGSSNYYKDVNAYRSDWKLMFNNPRAYNREDSWVCIDAGEMEKVFDAAFDRVTVGSGLPGAAPAAPAG